MREEKNESRERDFMREKKGRVAKRTREGEMLRRTERKRDDKG